VVEVDGVAVAVEEGGLEGDMEEEVEGVGRADTSARAAAGSCVGSQFCGMVMCMGGV
jgi:hypothetical protein